MAAVLTRGTGHAAEQQHGSGGRIHVRTSVGAVEKVLVTAVGKNVADLFRGARPSVKAFHSRICSGCSW